MVTVKDFNTPLSTTCKTSRQKIRKDMGEYRQLDLIVIYRTLHPATVEHAFFSGMHRNFYQDRIYFGSSKETQ